MGGGLATSKATFQHFNQAESASERAFRAVDLPEQTVFGLSAEIFQLA